MEDRDWVCFTTHMKNILRDAAANIVNVQQISFRFSPCHLDLVIKHLKFFNCVNNIDVVFWSSFQIFDVLLLCTGSTTIVHKGDYTKNVQAFNQEPVCHLDLMCHAAINGSAVIDSIMRGNCCFSWSPAQSVSVCLSEALSWWSRIRKAERP